MLPTSFPESNFLYGKPKGWTDEQCMDLPVWHGNVPIDDAGTQTHAIISCFKLNREDLEEIQKTGVIWLTVTADRMVPVSLQTENPFKPEENG